MKNVMKHDSEVLDLINRKNKFSINWKTQSVREITHQKQDIKKRLLGVFILSCVLDLCNKKYWVKSWIYISRIQEEV